MCHSACVLCLLLTRFVCVFLACFGFLGELIYTYDSAITKKILVYFLFQHCLC
jgi:hypothetical protein